jgi:hypothetical protein
MMINSLTIALRRRFEVAKHLCQNPDDLIYFGQLACSSCIDLVMRFIGPMLVLLALSIIGGLSRLFVIVLLPIICPPGDEWTFAYIAHCSFVFGFILPNIFINYYQCVVTKHKGQHYEDAVRALAAATNFEYPESQEGIQAVENDYEAKILERYQLKQKYKQQQLDIQELRAQKNSGTASPFNSTYQDEQQQQQQQEDAEGGQLLPLQQQQHSPFPPSSASSSASSSTINQRGGTNNNNAQYNAQSPQHNHESQIAVAAPEPLWLTMSPTEWSFCRKSGLPKPPRAHYDHVTKSLVLNMDHFCPWMANVIGYFNYRYFVNFLLYVFIGTAYGTLICLRPFLDTQKRAVRRVYQASVDHELGHTAKHVVSREFAALSSSAQRSLALSHEHRSEISIGFMLCLSVCAAVGLLFAFHLHLVLTGQTTIEFHGNWGKKNASRYRGVKWSNPYCLGWKRNWQQVYGRKFFLLAILPSARLPEFLPIPIAGHRGLYASGGNNRKGKHHSSNMISIV